MDLGKIPNILLVVNSQISYEVFIPILGVNSNMFGTSDTAHTMGEVRGQFLWCLLRPSPLPGIARSTTEDARHTLQNASVAAAGMYCLMGCVKREERLEKFDRKCMGMPQGNICWGRSAEVLA